MPGPILQDSTPRTRPEQQQATADATGGTTAGHSTPQQTAAPAPFATTGQQQAKPPPRPPITHMHPKTAARTSFFNHEVLNAPYFPKQHHHTTASTPPPPPPTEDPWRKSNPPQVTQRPKAADSTPTQPKATPSKASNTSIGSTPYTAQHPHDIDTDAATSELTLRPGWADPDYNFADARLDPWLQIPDMTHTIAKAEAAPRRSTRKPPPESINLLDID